MAKLFEDRFFPPTDSSWTDTDDVTLGSVVRQQLKDQDLLDAVQWLRPAEVLAEIKLDPMYEGICVYGSNLDPHDVRQGGVLGDCWLMSALACVAAHAPNLIRACFRKADKPGEGYSSKLGLASDGRYEVLLFDHDERVRVPMVIDDRIACVAKDTGGVKPLFASVLGTAMWPALLEKAFAKFCGSYSDIDNKTALWALEAIAGRPETVAQIYIKDADKDEWTCKAPKTTRGATKSKRTKRHTYMPSSTPIADAKIHTTTALLEAIRSKWSIGKEHLVVAVAAQEPLTDKGYKHAYSLLQVHNVTSDDGAGSSMIIQLRNPWGTETRWKGDWSDDSDMWKKHPDVAEAVRFRPCAEKEGVFWMGQQDFCRIFDGLHAVRMDLADDAAGMLVPSIYPAGMANSLRDFWTKHFSAQQDSVPWAIFKAACEQEAGAAALSDMDATIKQHAQEAGASIKAGSPFLECVVKKVMGCDDDPKVTPASLYMLQAKASGAPPSTIGQCLKQLANSYDYAPLFDTQLKQEMDDVCDVLLEPGAELGGTAAALFREYQDSREWLLQRFDGWLQGDGDGDEGGSSSSRLMVLQAGPGAGKSVFAAALATLRQDAVQAVHFLEEPGSIRGTLCCIAAQLAQRLPLVRQQLVEQLASKDLTSTSVEEASLGDLFKQLLSKPLWKLDKRKDERPKRLVLVLDGVQVLQEEKDYQLVQQMVTGRSLPAWVKLVVTARPVPRVKAGLQHQDLESTIIEPDDPHHQQDLCTYMRRVLRSRGLLEGHVLEQATQLLAHHNQPRFRYKGYKGLWLPQGKDLHAEGGAIAALEEFMAGDAGGEYAQQSGDNAFYMWPPAVHDQLLQGLCLAAVPEAATAAANQVPTTAAPAPAAPADSGRPHIMLLHGMFGLGKTTLAQHVKSVAEAVGRKVLWVHCGQVDAAGGVGAAKDRLIFNINEEFRKFADKDVDALRRAGVPPEPCVAEMLRRHPTLLLIIDDVWNVNAGAMDLMRHAFSFEGDVQVLLTSRNKLPPLEFGPNFRHLRMQEVALTAEQLTTPGSNGYSIAQTVLLERAFGGLARQEGPLGATGITFYENRLLLCKGKGQWEEVLDAILTRCAGCMLAVVMLASLLRGKVDVSDWQDTESTLADSMEGVALVGTAGDTPETQQQRRTIYSAAAMSIVALQPDGPPGRKQLTCLQAVAVFPSGRRVQPCYSSVVWRALLGAANIEEPDDVAAAHKLWLGRLADHSLVFKEGDGYKMHDIMAEYLLRTYRADYMRVYEAAKDAPQGTLKPSAALVGAAVVALCGRKSPRQAALQALGVPPRHLSYLAAASSDSYHGRPHLLLSCGGLSPDVACLVSSFLVAAVTGDATLVTKAVVAMVESCRIMQDNEKRENLAGTVINACKGLLHESLDVSGQWTQLSEQDTAATLQRLWPCMGDTRVRKACIVAMRVVQQFSRHYIQLNMDDNTDASSAASDGVEDDGDGAADGSDEDGDAASDAEGSANGEAGAGLQWVAENTARLRELLTPWRGPSPDYDNAEAEAIVSQLWELSFSPLLDAVDWLPICNVLVDAMAAYPWDDTDARWLQGRPVPSDVASWQQSHGWVRATAEGLLTQIVRLGVLRSMSMDADTANAVFNKTMQAMPYLAHSMGSGWFHAQRAPQVIVWLAQSQPHAEQMAEDGALVAALARLYAEAQGMPQGEARNIIEGNVPYALELIRRAAERAGRLKGAAGA